MSALNDLSPQYETMVLDWRGGNPDFSKWADYYSVYWTHTKRPAVANPRAKVLVACSFTILFDGMFPAGDEGSFNRVLWYEMKKLGAVTDLTVWQGSGGWHTVLIDITKRGVPYKYASLLNQFYPWADGFHMDYFTSMSWQFPELEPLNDKWDSALGAIPSTLRYLRPNILVIGQQFHLTAPVMTTNGEFWEVDPTSFGQTMESHALDAYNFEGLMHWADPTRPVLFVAELREPWRYPSWYIEKIKSWCASNGFVLSAGRDANAGWPV